MDELRGAPLTHHSQVSKEDCGHPAQKLEEQEDVNVGRERRAQTAHQQEAHGEQHRQAAAVPEDTAGGRGLFQSFPFDHRWKCTITRAKQSVAMN